MPQLVEDAGPRLSAGWIARFVRAMRVDRGVVTVGDREVAWELSDDVVIVRHAATDPRAKPLQYTVGLAFTKLPPGGLRCWYSCPVCGACVETLNLPPDRDRLACRRCCRLLYTSQYPHRKRQRRKQRPVVVVTRERKTWTPATGWLQTSRRRANL
jgi:hypothetical protein